MDSSEQKESNFECLKCQEYSTTIKNNINNSKNGTIVLLRGVYNHTIDNHEFDWFISFSLVNSEEEVYICDYGVNKNDGNIMFKHESIVDYDVFAHVIAHKKSFSLILDRRNRIGYVSPFNPSFSAKEYNKQQINHANENYYNGYAVAILNNLHDVQY